MPPVASSYKTGLDPTPIVSAGLQAPGCGGQAPEPLHPCPQPRDAWNRSQKSVGDRWTMDGWTDRQMSGEAA